MALLQYIEGYKGSLTFEGQEYSVEAWSATLTANPTTISASKNGGWTTRRRGFKDMTGNCTIVFENDVDTLTGTGLVPGSIGTLELIADTGVKYSGEFMIGDATWNWVPGDVNKIQCNFGNAEAITTLPG